MCSIRRSRSSRQATMTLHNWYVKTSLFIFINLWISLVAKPLSFNINKSNLHNANIAYEGDAHASSSRVIELNSVTVTYACRVGRVTYAEPLQLWDSTTNSLADFTTHFTFVVDLLNKNDPTNFYDGFTFFLVPVGYPLPPNSASGGLGLFNGTTYFAKSQNQIVAVEFDTYPNGMGEPDGPHVGIDVNEFRSDEYVRWNVNDYRGKLTNVWITYNASTYNLSAFWTYEGNPASVSTTNSSLSHHINLREYLPEQVTIGFSGAAGYSQETHTIHSWEFNSTLDSKAVNTNKNKEKRKKTVLIGVAAVSFFTLMLGLTIGWLVLRKGINRTPGKGNHSYDSLNTDLEILALPRRFAYRELVVATNDFADDTRLGQGGSGKVYKGIIQDLGCTVAVKRIFAKSERYEKIFINEVKVISRIMHRSLVQFLGWCYEQGECLLVYAYMPNGSLDTHLFDQGTTLQWGLRYKIALGLASALHYLHEDAEQCVLHRDIKSANILLDNDFNAKLGDFGIAKLVDPRLTTHHTTTGVVGTYGYMAPEYAKGGRASKESDMFSFGVVALEIACGRRTYQDGEYHVSLFGWVWQLYLAGNLLCVADGRLERNFDRNEMECLLIVGLWCTHPNKEERPKAGQVMKVLQLESPLPDLPRDMHDHRLSQPEQQADLASHVSLTSSLNTIGR